jgi:hypothetical protein
MMNYELERIWVETVVAYSRYYTGIFVKELRKTIKTLCQIGSYCCINLLGTTALIRTLLPHWM